MTTSTAAPSKTAQAVAAFLAECESLQFTVEAKQFGTGDYIVTVERTFAPGDRGMYVVCDAAAYHLLAMVPTVTYGSTWGTDGGSVGGHAGLTGGYYRLSKSGCSKRFGAAIAKAVAR